MKKIKSSRNKYFLVDDEDYEWLNRFKWTTNSMNYAMRYEKGKCITMHRLLMGNPNNMQVDHINGNRFDNRKTNLRICTQSQNCMNRKATTLGISGFKGVIRYGNRWQARIKSNGNRWSLGIYKTPQEAALAYNQAALKYFGEFAYLNKV